MFAKVLVAAGLAALAAAQSASLGFTSVPSTITAGQPEAIEYKASDLNSPVTITLRKGESGNLQTVSTLTSSATGGKYNWTPSTSLASGSDYALQITQGSETNYYGPFTLTGGSASGSVSATSSASHSASGYPSHSSSVVITSAVHNATTILTGTGSVGTGYPISRNTTMSRPTLTRTTSASGSASATGGSSQSTGAGAGFQGSQTGSPAASSTGGAAMMTTGGSVLALVFGAVAAAVFA